MSRKCRVNVKIKNVGYLEYSLTMYLVVIKVLVDFPVQSGSYRFLDHRLGK